jgi:hypothetical protein
LLSSIPLLNKFLICAVAAYINRIEILLASS